MSGMSGILTAGPSYDFGKTRASEGRSQSIDPNSFHRWQGPNMLVSTYAQYHSKQSVEPRVTAMPGYGGYIPSITAENIHAKRFSSMAKESFSNSSLGQNPFGLATSGHNVTQEAFVDPSKLGQTSKYGKSAIQQPHPSWNQPVWRSTTHDFYRPPNSQINPTYRETSKYLQTELPATKGSGFATNHSYLDGKGWNPDPILKGSNQRSEYRDRFNAALDFHRNTYVNKPRVLPRPEMNYDRSS